MNWIRALTRGMKNLIALIPSGQHQVNSLPSDQVRSTATVESGSGTGHGKNASSLVLVATLRGLVAETPCLKPGNMEREQCNRKPVTTLSNGCRSEQDAAAAQLAATFS